MKINDFTIMFTRVSMVCLLCFTAIACREDEPPLLPESVSLDRTAITLPIGGRDQLIATVLPEIISDKSHAWHSSNAAIATVDGNGNITGHMAGQATITVKTYQGGKTAICVVTVLADPVPVVSVSLNQTELEVAVGDSQTLTATILPVAATDKSLSWSSSAPAVATIDQNGAIAAASPGRTVITVVTYDGLKTANCVVTITAASSVPILAGLFTMGSPTREKGRELEEIERLVQLSAFRMSTSEITNVQYSAFLNAKNIGSDGKWAEATFDPSKVLVFDSSKGGRSNWGVNYDPASKKWHPAVGCERFPVVYVTWFGAIEFARWAGGTLPTEAQWEYACRGKNGNLPFGVDKGKRLSGVVANIAGKMIYDLDQGGEVADPSGVEQAKTCMDGNYDSNAYGLYDMHGNVAEWCLDWYALYSTSQPEYVDPQGPSIGTDGKRVVRGGSYKDKALFCRSAYRRGSTPETEMEAVGFRIVLPVK